MLEVEEGRERLLGFTVRPDLMPEEQSPCSGHKSLREFKVKGSGAITNVDSTFEKGHQRTLNLCFHLPFNNIALGWLPS